MFNVVRPIPITDQVVISNPIAENEYPMYVPGNTYNLGETVIYEHKVYKCGADNVTALPTDKTKWVDIGTTNAWGMFDYKTGAYTESAGDVTITLQPNAYFKVLALLDIIGTGVTVKMTHDSLGVIYDQYHSLLDYGVANWYEYFTTLPTFKSDLLITDLPTAPTAVVEITIHANELVRVGALMLGQSKLLGDAQYDLSGGQTDYSTVQDDPDTGTWTIIKRPSVKRRSFPVRTPTSQIDRTERFLKSISGDPCLIIASSTNIGMVMYGFVIDFEFTAKNQINTYWTVDTRGLM